MTLQDVQQYNNVNIRQQTQDDTISPQVVADALDNVAAFASANPGPQGLPGTSGSSPDYSSTTNGGVPQGYKWIDGKEVYKAVVHVVVDEPGSFNLSNKSVIGPLNINGNTLHFDTVISVNGWFIAHETIDGIASNTIRGTINGSQLKIDVQFYAWDYGGYPNYCLAFDGTALPDPTSLHHLYVVVEFTSMV